MEICLIRPSDFLGAQAERLENRADAVHEVRAEQGHGDDVEGGDVQDAEPGKAVDDHQPGVVDLALDAVDGGLVAGQRVVFIPDAGGEMQHVVDHEGEDGEAGEDHGPRGFGGLDGGLVFVGLAGGAVLAGEGRWWPRCGR